MSLMYRPAMRIVAICVGLVLMQVYVVATPPHRGNRRAQAQTGGQRVGRLITRSGKNITVNGQVASNGATILTDSKIETPDDAGATIVLKDLATVEIGPNTELVLDFSSGRLSLKILKGCARSRVKEGVDYSETTQPGEPTQKQKDGKTICVGATAIARSSQTASSVGAGTGGGLLGLNIPVFVGLIGAGVAVTAVVVAMHNNNEMTAPVISPIR